MAAAFSSSALARSPRAASAASTSACALVAAAADPSATPTRMVVPPSSTAAKRVPVAYQTEVVDAMVPNAASRHAGLEESATMTSTDAGHWHYTLFGATL